MSNKRLAKMLVSGELQDGMLAHYIEQAKASDANVEARLEREPFDYRDMNETLYGRGSPRCKRHIKEDLAAGIHLSRKLYGV